MWFFLCIYIHLEKHQRLISFFVSVSFFIFPFLICCSRVCVLSVWCLFCDHLQIMSFVMKFYCRIYCFRLNGAIMIKQMLIAVVLILLLSGHSWDAEASRRSIRPDQTVDVQLTETKVREKRFVNPFTGLFSIWNALTHIYSLYVEVSWHFHCHTVYTFWTLYRCIVNLLHFQFCVDIFSKKTKRTLRSNKHMIL